MNLEIVERIFRVIPDIVFCVKDEGGVYRAANPAFAHRLGLVSKDEVIGKRPEELFSNELAEVYRRQDDEVLLRGGEFTDRLELISNRDGSVGWYLASKFLLKDEEGLVTGLVSISRDLDTPSLGDVKMSGLQRVVDWVHDNLEEELTVEVLARVAGMKPGHLERRVKRVFKVSVGQFVRKMRIDLAARLLRDTELGIAEIALRCGYSEQSSLTRQFKAAVGCPPGEFRKRLSDV
ncbi:MAG: PAS domain S-box-containing protein [Akkermansiaceae bacterium]|jgi:PAS domain S-box-containing protein